MFSFFKKNNDKKSSTGFFIPKNLDFVELEGIENMSINQICTHLGYHPDTTFTHFVGYEPTDEIQCLIFKIFTKEIVFIVTNKTVLKLSSNKISSILNKLSFKEIYSTSTIEDILNDGIENESLSSELLYKNLKLNDMPSDGILFSERLGLHLHFNGGVLTDYQSADGLNSWAKEWKDLNPKMVESYEKEAEKHWGKKNISQILNEINVQAESWADLPSPVDNPYIILHKSPLGNINYYNLLVAHYDKIVTEKEFTKINYGRFEVLKSQNEMKRYKVGKFIYEFGFQGEILNSYSID